MKKIVYSILIALVLSVILALLGPRWLFKGDARWTYQNDAARVDISFGGHLKNGRVSAEGTDMRITQPAWLSKESYQGTMVEFPVSYRTKSYQIKLSPEADAWGKDAALTVEFRGQSFRHKEKRRPAWVVFQNITLNGQSVAVEKVVCHDQPFTLKYPSPTSEITLSFDVRKPLTASDISFKNLLGVFLACLVLCLLFASPKVAECHIPEFMYRKDVIKVLSDGYHRIDPVYRRSFWIIFGVLCFAFGFHTICFMWGNHDWKLLESKVPWLSHQISGRYMVSSIKVSLLKGIYLPFVHDFIIFITLATNAVLLCRYWCLKKRVAYFVLCGLVLTVQPFTLCMIWYVNMTPEVFIGVTCVLVALLVSEKITLLEMSPTRKVIYSILAIILTNFALAMYPVLINTIAVAFVGRLLILSFDWDGSRQKLKSCMRVFMISAINIVSGIALYKLIITFIFPISRFYNTETLPLRQVSERLGVLFKQCIHQLYEYNYPFISQWTLWVFLGFTIALVLSILFTGNIKQKIVRLLLLFGALFATQTAMIIAKEHAVDGRVELFGLPFFEVLVTVLCITWFWKLRNLFVSVGSCVIFASVINDLDCLRMWKLGFDAENMLWNRILVRLEMQKGFNPVKKYDVVQIGWPISMRPRYYAEVRKKFVNKRLPSMFDSYDHFAIPFGPPSFYYPTHFLGRRFSSLHSYKNIPGNPDYEARLRRLYQAGVLQKAEVWPKPNGLIVWKNIILFVTEKKGLDYYRKKFERELGKK